MSYYVINFSRFLQPILPRLLVDISKHIIVFVCPCVSACVHTCVHPCKFTVARCAGEKEVITEFRMFEILDKLQNTSTGLDLLPA